MKKVKVGDIFEIYLKDEKKAFGHYVFDDSLYGPLIQVYYLIVHKKEKIDPARLLNTSLLFPPVFTSPSVGVKMDMWRVIANIPLKKFIFPRFVSTLFSDKTGKAGIWFLWNGKKDIRIGWKLPKKYKKYEFLILWPPKDIVDRIQTREMPFPYKDLIEKNEFTPIVKK
jgi:hypothetical protein